jgi:hypothetical protein
MLPRHHLQGFGGMGRNAPQLLRVGVAFPPGGHGGNTQSKGAARAAVGRLFGDVLGRTAHISLLEDGGFTWLLAWAVAKRWGVLPPAAVVCAIVVVSDWSCGLHTCTAFTAQVHVLCL